MALLETLISSLATRLVYGYQASTAIIGLQLPIVTTEVSLSLSVHNSMQVKFGYSKPFGIIINGKFLKSTKRSSSRQVY